MAVIYLITNTTSGKQYVGYTKYDAEFRFKQHCTESNSASSYSILHEALRKYGANNFTVEVLESSDDAEYLHSVREKFWIAEKGTMSPNGYNVQEGGEGNRNPSSRRPCELYDGELNLFKSFDSVTELSLHLGIPHARGYIAANNVGKKRPEHSEFMKQYNKQRLLNEVQEQDLPRLHGCVVHVPQPRR